MPIARAADRASNSRPEGRDVVTNLLLRHAEVRDAEAVGGVMCRALQAAYLDAALASTPSRQRLAELRPGDLVVGARRLIAGHDDADFTLLAETGDEVVGLSRLRVGPERGSPVHGEIASLYVDPSSWGSGHGGRLLEGAIEQLRRRGCSRVWLWVAVENERARTFYRRHGFTPDGTEDRHRLDVWGVDLGFDLHVVRMARDLRSNDREETYHMGGH